MTVVGGAFRGIGVGGEVGGLQWGREVVKVIGEELRMDKGRMKNTTFFCFYILHVEVARGAGHCSLVGGDVGEASEALEWSSR